MFQVIASINLSFFVFDNFKYLNFFIYALLNLLLYIIKMTTKINVLQVIPRLGYGGAETGCYDIAHYLTEQNCGSYIATSGGELLKFVKKNKVRNI